MGRFKPPPRLTDLTLLVGVGVVVATGLFGLVTGRPRGWWVFAAHGVAGLALVVVLGWKLRRVRARLRPGAWDRRVALSVALAAATTGALVTGVYWAVGGTLRVLAWNGLVVHMVLGTLVVPLLFVHLTYRWRSPARTDLGRRTAVTYVGLVALAAATWVGQRALARLLETPAAGRRFTGSRERASLAGNAFPTTSWVADDPDPVDPKTWRLSVGGRVANPFSVGHDDLLAPVGDDVDTNATVVAAGGGENGAESEADSRVRSESEMRVTLDCTSGWYSVQDWRGVRVGDLVARADPADDARWVRFTSVTGYRWSLPLPEARDALLATHVGGERLSHGHGFPLRLVAPGRRGFQWVKWVEAVELRTRPDPGQWVAILVSGFDG